MPRSLLIATGFPPQIGGIQTMLYKITANFPCEEIVVLTPAVEGDRDSDARHNFRVYRQRTSILSTIVSSIAGRFISSLLAQSFLYLPPATTLLKGEDIEVVQCGHINAGLVGYLLKRLLGTPYVIYTYAQEILQASIPERRLMDRALKRLVFRNADAIITISEYTRQKVLQWGVKEAKIAKIPLGADLASLADDSESGEIINRLFLHDKRIVFTAARLVERKGHDMVIKSLPMVLKRVPNVVYLIVGSGPMEDRLNRLIDELNLRNQVIFVGDVSHESISAYYRACDVFVMPSRALEEKGDVEGFGLVYLEANACGKPVIGGRSGGVPDAVLDGVTGLLVDSWSVEEISDAIIKLLTNRDYARKLGDNGRRRIEREMNWTNAARKVQEVLQKVVKKS